MIKTISQKGFAAIEMLLIVAVVTIVGGTGYYVYHANKKTNATLDSASKVAQSSPQKTQKKKTTATAPKASTAPTAPATTPDDKTAIITAAQNYASKVISPASSTSATYSVTDISGNTAWGSIRPSEGDPLTYYAQKQNGTWQVVYLTHMPADGSICAKYGMPSSWCVAH